MSELKVKYNEDSEFKCIRRIATKLGLSMPESDDEVLNLSQYRRIERAISKEFESLSKLTAIATNHATRADELYEALDGMIGIWKLICETNGWDEDHLTQAVTAKAVLDKSRIEAEGE